MSIIQKIIGKILGRKKSIEKDSKSKNNVSSIAQQGMTKLHQNLGQNTQQFAGYKRHGRL